MDRKPFLVALAELIAVYSSRLNLQHRRWLQMLLPTPGNILFTLLIVAAFFWVQSIGAFPNNAPRAFTSTGTIAYQGRLANASGSPVTGTYNMLFRLYNASSGGTPLWEEYWMGSNSVSVSNGLFNVMLGSLTPIPQSVITGNSTLWLGVTVGTDSEMTPRAQVGSAPFAMQALTVPDGSVTTAKIAANAVSQYQAVTGSTGASTSSTSFVDIPNLSVTLTTTGGSVLVMFSGSHTPENISGVVGYWQIIRDDSTVLAFNNQGFAQYEWATTTLFGIDTPPAGTHTYKVQWRVSQGTLLASAGVYYENFAAIEFKR